MKNTLSLGGALLAALVGLAPGCTADTSVGLEAERAPRPSSRPAVTPTPTGSPSTAPGATVSPTPIPGATAGTPAPAAGTVVND